MHPFFLKSKQDNLYAVFHEPFRLTNKQTGIIICPPIAQEHIRTYKTLFLLAQKLSERQFLTLRFDYFGCGDSSGDLLTASIETWLANIEDAINEFKSAYTLKKIVLIGVRLGGSLVNLFVKRNQKDNALDQVLWCPVLNGKQYIYESRKLYRQWLKGSFAVEISSKQPEFQGFAFSKSILDDISAIDINPNTQPKAKLVLDRDHSELGIDFMKTSGAEFWIKKENDDTTSLVPYSDLELLLEWMSKTYD